MKKNIVVSIAFLMALTMNQVTKAGIIKNDGKSTLKYMVYCLDDKNKPVVEMPEGLTITDKIDEEKLEVIRAGSKVALDQPKKCKNKKLLITYFEEGKAPKTEPIDTDGNFIIS